MNTRTERRIERCFAELDAAGRKGLITFVTAGDPDIAATPELMHALVAGGADIIELGVPFSDPMADGEVIQRASERALEHGTSLADVLEAVGRFRRTDDHTPVVLMGYLNPFERMGASQFSERATANGVDGVLIVDLPPEESAGFSSELSAAGLDQVFLVAPNSSDARIEQVCAAASGFVYFVSVKGVTGDKAAAVSEIGSRISTARRFSSLPLGIGFGIRTPAAAADAAAVADAVIVGSAIVELIEKGGADAGTQGQVQGFVSALREALDASAAAA